MTMRVAIVNPVWESSASTPEETLRRFSSLTGWATAVAEAGASVTVHQRFRTAGRIEQAGVSYRFVGDRGGPTPALWSGAREIAASVIATRADIVHVNGVVFPQWVRALRRTLPTTMRLVVQDHGGWHPDEASAWSRRWVGSGLSVVDALLLSSVGQAGLWRSVGVVPPSVPVMDVMEASTHLRPMPKAEAAATSGVIGDPAVLWVGRLTPNKDPLTMLDGFARFADGHAGSSLTMVFQGGPLLDKVRERVARDRLLSDRVRLIGAVPAEQMAAYYSAADIFVSASHHEGSGYAAIEAMACGAAPVLTDIPSFRTMTDQGRTGLLWRAGEPHTLGATLSKMASELSEAERSRVLARFDSALSWEAVGRRAVEIYRDVLAR